MKVTEFVLALLYPDLLKAKMDIENAEPLSIIKNSNVCITDGPNDYEILSVYYCRGKVCVDISIKKED